MKVQKYQWGGGWGICCRVRKWGVIEVLLNLYMALILGGVLMVIVNELAELIRVEPGGACGFPCVPTSIFGI